MEDLDEKDVMRIIEAFSFYRTGDKEVVNLIQRIHKLIDLGLQHNASSFNVNFIEQYLKNLTGYDSNFIPSYKIVSKSVGFLIQNEASLSSAHTVRMNLTGELLNCCLKYKLDSPQIQAFILKNFKAFPLLRFHHDKIKKLVNLAVRYYSEKPKRSEKLEELKTYLKNLEVSSDFMNIPSIVKLIQVSYALNDEELMNRRYEDLLTYIPQVNLHQILNETLEDLIVSIPRFNMNEKVVLQLFSRENLAQDLAGLNPRKTMGALLVAFHGLRDNSPVHQEVLDIFKGLSPEKKKQIFHQNYEILMKNFNERTVTFIKDFLEEYPDILHESVKLKLAKALTLKMNKSYERDMIRDQALRCVQTLVESARFIFPYASILQKLRISSPKIREKLEEAILPSIQEIKPGKPLYKFLREHRLYGSDLRALSCNLNVGNAEAFQIIMNSLKIYSDTMDSEREMPQKVEESSSSSSSEEQFTETKKQEFYGIRQESQYFRMNLDMMVSISELITKIPSSFSVEETNNAREFLVSLYQKIERTVGGKYKLFRSASKQQKEVVKMIFDRGVQLDQVGNDQEGWRGSLGHILKPRQANRLIFGPGQWMEIINGASRTDMDQLYFEGPFWKRGSLRPARKEAVYLLIQDYQKMNKVNLDFHFDQMVFNFITQHRIRNVNFINNFIQRLGDCFSKLNYQRVKRLPMSFMRAGLNQSDIFKSLSTKSEALYYQRNIFPSLFTNGVRLQIHKEDWFMKYARDFFDKYWKESKFTAKGIIFLLEGAYFALEEPNTEFLHQPIAEMLQRLSSFEKFPIIGSPSGQLINLLHDRTNEIPEGLRIKDEKLKQNLEEAFYFKNVFINDFNQARTHFGNHNVTDKINEAFNWSGDDQARINDGSVPGILIPKTQVKSFKFRNYLVQHLQTQDLLFDLITPNHLGVLKRKVAENAGFKVIEMPLGYLKKAKTDEQLKTVIKEKLSPYIEQNEHTTSETETKETEPETP